MGTALFSYEELRDTAWAVGQHYPLPKQGDWIALATQQPHQGCFVWNLESASVEALQANSANALFGSAHVVRIYDITEIDFNGLNAHSFFDIDVSGLNGRRFFHTGHTARLLLAEIGFRLTDGTFNALARSQPVFFDRPGSSGNFAIQGRYVSPCGSVQFEVDNIFDAPVYSRFAECLRRRGEKSPPPIGVIGLHTGTVNASPLQEYCTQLSRHWQQIGVKVHTVTEQENALNTCEPGELMQAVDALREQYLNRLTQAWSEQSIQLIFAQNILSAAVVLPLVKKMKLPLVVALHTLSEGVASPLGKCLRDYERQIVQAATRIIVPDSATEQRLRAFCGAGESQTYVIAEVLKDSKPVTLDPGSIKQQIHLHPAQPLVLFSGEISHATGADLLVDAIFQVAGQTDMQFVFVGDGFLKNELEHRIWGGNLGHRVKFVGHVDHASFENLLLASEFVVIPARTWQDPAVAQMAVNTGRPVLTTHQAGIGNIRHGQNGLVTYDNPGSIIWGLKEMLANPLQGNMLRIVARKNAEQGKTLASAAVEHLICFLHTLNSQPGKAHYHD